MGVPGSLRYNDVPTQWSYGPTDASAMCPRKFTGSGPFTGLFLSFKFLNFEVSLNSDSIHAYAMCWGFNSEETFIFLSIILNTGKFFDSLEFLYFIL